MIYMKEALERLKQGAIIEFTVWGEDYPIYIRYSTKLGDSDGLHRSSFTALRRRGLIKQIKRDGLSQIRAITEEKEDA